VTDTPNPPEPAHQPDSGVPAPPVPAPRPGPEVDAEPAPDDGEPNPAPRTRGRTLRIVLASVLGGLAVLCVGGLGTGYLLYQKVSEPDRRTPAVAVEQFVDAMLNERDTSRAHQFTCRSNELGDLNQLFADIRTREEQFKTRFTVQTADLDVHQNGGSATVDTDLQLTTSVSRSTQRWRFSLKNQSGWRVCTAHRTA
jgi:hypothetical protein